MAHFKENYQHGKKKNCTITNQTMATIYDNKNPLRQFNVRKKIKVILSWLFFDVQSHLFLVSASAPPRRPPPPPPPWGLGILGGGVPSGSLNLNSTSDQKMPFSLPLSDLAFKIRTRT